MSKMKVVFVSNYFNHHQQPFSDEMAKLTNGEYRFIQTIPMEEERKNMGWDMDSLPDYVLNNYENEDCRKKCQKTIDEADVVIIGSASHKLVEYRLKQNKLVFFYSERVYKKKRTILKYPYHCLKNFFQYNRYKNVYMLCASAYTALDYAMTFSFLGKTYKWGYFPVLKRYEDIDELIDSKKKNSILWVARLIDLKHPEIPIKIARLLKDEGCVFELSLIGNGELEENLKALIKELKVEDCVKTLGSMKPEQVRQYMEKSDIFLFTSDRNEGWGAVLNESMNSGCAVVASHAIGSVPFLIQDEKNGLIYKDGNIEDLFVKVKDLLTNVEKRKQIAKNAYKTMETQWNAEVAGIRFLELVETLLDNKKTEDLFKDGVCSKAEILKDNWYR